MKKLILVASILSVVSFSSIANESQEEQQQKRTIIEQITKELKEVFNHFAAAAPDRKCIRVKAADGRCQRDKPTEPGGE
ncbi:hypothetical protein [Thalassotalea piscium]|uniref:Uncharacterized protein n=1 Tax=Thalassotalea piscium TaxID=1230533 RepID=A0A7X0NGU3_9GAMM|nr:hypothetical protein [Thalassotalea piscium]MBB6543154.1 hypothetical protein [Thalassotalea piscium]